jgi:hypothetical protein
MGRWPTHVRWRIVHPPQLPRAFHLLKGPAAILSARTPIPIVGYWTCFVVVNDELTGTSAGVLACHGYLRQRTPGWSPSWGSLHPRKATWWLLGWQLGKFLQSHDLGPVI